MPKRRGEIQGQAQADHHLLADCRRQGSRVPQGKRLDLEHDRVCERGYQGTSGEAPWSKDRVMEILGS